jgi:hypothetical protein
VASIKLFVPFAVCVHCTPNSDPVKYAVSAERKRQRLADTSGAITIHETPASCFGFVLLWPLQLQKEARR